MNKFFTQFERPFEKGEINSGELIVEVAGYVPAQKQITNLLNAGRRLDEFRKGQFEFDFDEEVPEGYRDFTRDPNFDVVDASELSNALSKKRKELEALNEKRAQEALQASQEVAEEVSVESKS